MFYQNELNFLCEVFQKCHVNTMIVEQHDFESTFAEKSLDTIFNHRALFQEIFLTLLPHTLYKFTDSLEFCYRFLLLPARDGRSTVLCIGPFLETPVSAQRLLEIGEENGISPQKQGYLSEYYLSLPILPDDCPVLTMLHTFCERIWKDPSFPIKDITNEYSLSDTPFSRSMSNLDPNDTLINMKAIERRYSFENEMIRAVSLGQPHMEQRFSAAFSSQAFEKRVADPLRNAKNYGIIMNTLLRKAAERGGVHPVYLDQISSEFASKIEKMSSLSEIPTLMGEMFRTYCRLVRKHSLQPFSPVVQQTILIIDADLSADLSPNLLAESQGITLGYLSTIFKKETGKTISEYVRERRMEYAEYLLNTTNLQIQTVALHCGILDVQYFSKLFKKHFGKTPTEYRRVSGKTKNHI